MVDPLDILKFTDEIARQFKPSQIILFGSYAYGTPTQDSDVDLLVVKSYRGASYREATRIRIAIDISFPLDLIVRTSFELAKRIALNDWFLIEAVQQGIVLYAEHDPAMGAKGRRRLHRRLRVAAVA